MWQERRDATTVRRFLGAEPTSTVGRLALARVLMGEGDHVNAEREVRAVWRAAELSAEMETATLEAFRDQLSPADDRARMDRRIGAKDFAAAMRAAKRLGNDEVAIVKACAAAEANSSKSEALLAAVSAKANQDLGYALCRLHWLVRRAPSISTTCRQQKRLDLCKSPRKPDATPPNDIASNTIGSGSALIGRWRRDADSARLSQRWRRSEPCRLADFHHALNVITRLGQRDAFYPIDRIHFGIARIAVLRHPLPNSPAPRVVASERHNKGAAILP